MMGVYKFQQPRRALIHGQLRKGIWSLLRVEGAPQEASLNLICVMRVLSTFDRACLVCSSDDEQ